VDGLFYYLCVNSAGRIRLKAQYLILFCRKSTPKVGTINWKVLKGSVSCPLHFSLLRDECIVVVAASNLPSRTSSLGLIIRSLPDRSLESLSRLIPPC
jgi:hypothetical protein